MVLWESKEIGGNSVDTMMFDYPTAFKDPNDHSILFDERMSLVLAGFLGFVENDYVDSGKFNKKFEHDQLMLMKYSNSSRFPLSTKESGDHIMIMYYLNDDYEGGAIEFPGLDISYKPKANEALIFPGTDGFEYTVAEVTSGTKYAVISYLR